MIKNLMINTLTTSYETCCDWSEMFETGCQKYIKTFTFSDRFFSVHARADMSVLEKQHTDIYIPAMKFAKFFWFKWQLKDNVSFILQLNENVSLNVTIKWQIVI